MGVYLDSLRTYTLDMTSAIMVRLCSQTADITAIITKLWDFLCDELDEVEGSA